MEIKDILSIWNLNDAEIIDQYHSDTIRKFLQHETDYYIYIVMDIGFI